MENEFSLGKEMEHLHCAKCETHFLPSRRWQRFCSAICRDDWHNKERRAALTLYRGAKRNKISLFALVTESRVFVPLP